MGWSAAIVIAAILTAAILTAAIVISLTVVIVISLSTNSGHSIIRKVINV